MSLFTIYHTLHECFSSLTILLNKIISLTTIGILIYLRTCKYEASQMFEGQKLNNKFQEIEWYQLIVNTIKR